jgi:uncharacterized repeat protein (TIGR04076 family)
MLHDVKVTVEEVRGKCTSGLKPGDYFLLRSGRLSSGTFACMPCTLFCRSCRPSNVLWKTAIG